MSDKVDAIYLFYFLLPLHASLFFSAMLLELSHTCFWFLSCSSLACSSSFSVVSPKLWDFLSVVYCIQSFPRRFFHLCNTLSRTQPSLPHLLALFFLWLFTILCVSWRFVGNSRELIMALPFWQKWSSWDHFAAQLAEGEAARGLSSWWQGTLDNLLMVSTLQRSGYTEHSYSH